MTAGRARRFSALGVAVVSILASQAGMSSHVLDQYLQATRIDVRRGAVDFEIDLTPGVEVAPQIFFQINTDHDGVLSDGERRAYATRVLNDLVITLDQAPLRPRLVDDSFPGFDAMRAGTGTIRLRVTASTPFDLALGQHRLFYRNQHGLDRGVYVVNALVPSVREITIDAQHRDPLQREVRIDFTVASHAPASSARWALPVLFAALIVIVVSRRRLR